MTTTTKSTKRSRAQNFASRRQDKVWKHVLGNGRSSVCPKIFRSSAYGFTVQNCEKDFLFPIRVKINASFAPAWTIRQRVSPVRRRGALEDDAIARGTALIVERDSDLCLAVNVLAIKAHVNVIFRERRRVRIFSSSGLFWKRHVSGARVVACFRRSWAIATRHHSN